jgi:hypothetical protein
MGRLTPDANGVVVHNSGRCFAGTFERICYCFRGLRHGVKVQEYRTLPNQYRRMGKTVAKVTDPTCLNCSRCGVDAITVQITSNEWGTRVRRFSKCKGYRAPGQAGGHGKTCSGTIQPTKAAAIEAWNAMQAGCESPAANEKEDAIERLEEEVTALKARVAQLEAKGAINHVCLDHLDQQNLPQASVGENGASADCYCGN